MRVGIVLTCNPILALVCLRSHKEEGASNRVAQPRLLPELGEIEPEALRRSSDDLLRLELGCRGEQKEDVSIEKYQVSPLMGCGVYNGRHTDAGQMSLEEQGQGSLLPPR